MTISSSQPDVPPQTILIEPFADTGNYTFNQGMDVLELISSASPDAKRTYRLESITSTEMVLKVLYKNGSTEFNYLQTLTR